SSTIWKCVAPVFFSHVQHSLIPCGELLNSRLASRVPTIAQTLYFAAAMSMPTLAMIMQSYFLEILRQLHLILGNSFCLLHGFTLKTCPRSSPRYNVARTRRGRPISQAVSASAGTVFSLSPDQIRRFT